jgi:hypothetical protein
VYKLHLSLLQCTYLVVRIVILSLFYINPAVFCSTYALCASRPRLDLSVVTVGSIWRPPATAKQTAQPALRDGRRGRSTYATAQPATAHIHVQTPSRRTVVLRRAPRRLPACAGENPGRPLFFSLYASAKTVGPRCARSRRGGRARAGDRVGQVHLPRHVGIR